MPDLEKNSAAEKCPDTVPEEQTGMTPSCARIIYDYYGGAKRFAHYDAMMAAVDKVDSAQLTADEVLHPTGWVLLGFIMEIPVSPRTPSRLRM